MLKGIFELFFTPRCYCCNQRLPSTQKDLCVTCRHHLPLTNYHYHNDPALKKVFYGRIQIELGTALFFFEKKGPVQHILHRLKYKGQPQISVFLGKWLGADLAQIPSYQKIDVVIPVPVHPKKKKIRGYNQVSGFAHQIAKSLGIHCYEDILIKRKNTKTQVFKKRMGRSDDVLDAFYCSDTQHICGKHILLVDDIITTGATLEACAAALNEAQNIKISIATMAIAI